MRRGVVLLLGTLASLQAVAVDVFVEALLPGVAVMQIDGARVTLRAGQLDRGVRLIDADSESAVVEIGGQRQRLRVSQRISGQYSEPQQRTVRIPRNDQMQYQISAEINGVRVPAIVDTGANIVALNGRHARAVGIDPEQGLRTSVQTAGSLVPARRVQLDSISVGGIRVDAVAATVIEGDYPAVVLLGMSFLQHVELEDRGGVLTLKARW